MSDGLDRLPPDVKALIRASNEQWSVPDDARARLADRLMIGAPALGPGHGAPSAPLGGGLAAAGAKVLLVLAIGGGLVATIRAVDSGRHVAPHAVSNPGAAPETSGVRVAPVIAPPDETPVRSALPPRAPASVPPARSAATATLEVAPSASLQEERNLLDAARAAIVRGNPEAALAPTATHAARFPRGALAEERDALRIRALARLGRSEDARALLETMRAKYPFSFLLPGAEADVVSIP